MKGMKRHIARLRATRLGRALDRYSTARGALLAGGIAYTGLVSLFAALAIGVSVLMATLGRHPDLRAAVLGAVNDMLPGVVDLGHGGLLSVDQLTVDSALNLGSIIAGATLLYAAMGLMGALKNGVRAMFGIVMLPVNPALGQLVNLAGFVAVMLAVALTAAASLLAGGLGDLLGHLPGPLTYLAGPGASVAAVAGSFMIDAAVVALLIRLSGPRVPRRDLVAGAALAALGLGALRLAGTGVIGGITRNPLLASFAAVATIVLWLHLATRVLLLVCAWMANPPAPATIAHPDDVHGRECPNYVTLSSPHTLEWQRQTLTGTVDIQSGETVIDTAAS